MIPLRNHRGQIAIFVALIFQLLFVFFAMVINVGLLVHHKINLQSSVDLAAYYGAMKQAESLNAIAHINYQIRQSYKLLSMRYLAYGMGGDEEMFRSIQEGRIPQDAPTPMSGAFCMAYDNWSFVSPNESYCRSQRQILPIRLPQPPPLATGNSFINRFFSGPQINVISAIRAIQQGILNNCRDVTNFNYYLAARFIFAWRLDVHNRRTLLMRLARDISDPTGGLDLEGSSIRTGIETTLKNNLTAPNNEGDLRFEVFNSLGHPDCRGGTGEFSTPSWLSEIYILPAFIYMNGTCSRTDQVVPAPSFVSKSFPGNLPGFLPSGRPGHRTQTMPPIDQAIDQIEPWMDEPPGTNPQQNMYKSMIGYEKNPWCPAYVGVSAQARPRIPFSPFGTVRLTARAFAKPFGASIGPWDKSSWSPSSNHSDGSKRVDPLIPDRHLPAVGVPTPDPRLTGNFSRFVGDQVGFRSERTLWDFIRAVNNNRMNGMRMDPGAWTHLHSESHWLHSPNTEGEALAWNYQDRDAGPGIQLTENFRELELAAVSPNQFDLTYYSIEPDFYRNYLFRLNQRQGRDLQFNVRGDFGSKKQQSGGPAERFSVKEQISQLIRPSRPPLPIRMDLHPHLAINFAELLTSYQSVSTETHELDAQRFGQCEYPVPDDAGPESATTGNCIAGGRVGYSVKLVDGMYLRRTNLDFGGQGAPTGQIRNPWNDNDLPR